MVTKLIRFALVVLLLALVGCGPRVIVVRDAPPEPKAIAAVKSAESQEAPAPKPKSDHERAGELSKRARAVRELATQLHGSLRPDVAAIANRIANCGEKCVVPEEQADFPVAVYVGLARHHVSALNPNFAPALNEPRVVEAERYAEKA